MKKNLFLACVFLCASAARADDITLTDGTVYKNAKILNHDAVNATILYADGGVTVPISKLPKATQTALGYDPAVANAKLQAEAAERQQEYAKRREAEAIIAHGAIRRVLPEGVIIELSAGDGAEANFLGLSLVRCDTNNLVAGKHWEGKIWPDGEYLYTDESGERNTIRKFTAVEAEALAAPVGG